MMETGNFTLRCRACDRLVKTKETYRKSQICERCKGFHDRAVRILLFGLTALVTFFATAFVVAVLPGQATVSTTHTENTYVGNGSQTNFSFSFRIISGNDIVVLVDDAIQSTSNYQVSISSSGVGGTVLFLAAPGVGADVKLMRSTPQTQTTTFPPEAKLNTKALETALDRNTLMVQELKTQLDEFTAGSGGHVIRDDGIDLPERLGLNFAGVGIFATDDPGDNQTEITLDGDLNALAGLSSTGLVQRTGSDSYTLMSVPISTGNGGTGVTSLSDVLGTANQITVSSGTARVIGGNVTLTLPSVIIMPGTGAFTPPSGTTGQRPADSPGLVRYNTSDNKLEYNTGSGWVQLAAGGGGTPGGSNTQVQFNDSSAFGGDAGFVYDKTTDTATLGTLLLTNDLAVAQGGTGVSALSNVLGTTDQITVSGGTARVIGGDITLTLPDPVVLPGTNALTIPVGTTGQRPANGAGKIRFNTTDGKFEYNDGSAWIQPGTGGGSPGGANTQVQFNDSSAFGGDAGLVYIKASDRLELLGPLRSVTQIEDVNGNEVVKFGSTASAVNEVTIKNAATGNPPRIEPTGTDANIGLRLASKGTGIIRFEDFVFFEAARVVNDLGETIFGFNADTFGKTSYIAVDAGTAAVNPKFYAAGETNIGLEIRSAGTGDVVLASETGEEILKADDVANAVNEITVTNATTGAGPKIGSTGDDTNIDVEIDPKGTGVIDVNSSKIKDCTQVTDADGNEVVIFGSTGSAVNEVTIQNHSTGNAPIIKASGGDTNIGLDLESKGTGTIRANGVPIAAASVKVKTADLQISNDATLTVDSDFTVSMTVSNGTYSFDYYLSVVSGATPDFQMQIDGPSGCTISYGVDASSTDPTAVTAGGTPLTLACGGSANNEFFHVYGSIILGATTGNLTLSWAQATSNATTTTLKANSRVVVMKSN